MHDQQNIKFCVAKPEDGGCTLLRNFETRLPQEVKTPKNIINPRQYRPPPLSHLVVAHET